mmetsp:Transcript_17411/g.33052  ORF Transcript_17411/g.33052 Transcript_17411/m.33052 type:complete len:200 (+) Transcript_17411:1-600(+)
MRGSLGRLEFFARLDVLQGTFGAFDHGIKRHKINLFIIIQKFHFDTTKSQAIKCITRWLFPLGGQRGHDQDRFLVFTLGVNRCVGLKDHFVQRKCTCFVGAQNRHSCQVFNGRQLGHDCTMFRERLGSNCQRGRSDNFYGQRNRRNQEDYGNRQGFLERDALCHKVDEINQTQQHRNAHQTKHDCDENALKMTAFMMIL